MSVIPLRMSDQEVQILDALVKSRKFRSRNEAIRSLLRTALKTHETSVSRDIVKAAVRRLSSLEGGVFRGPRSAADLVSEGRSRW